MSINKKIIIVGAFHEIIELALNCKYKIVGLIDNIKVGKYLGYKILCNDVDSVQLKEKFKKYPLVICPDLPKVRKILSSFYNKNGFSFISLISEESKISSSSILGDGVVIQYGVNVSSQCKLGNFVKLNTYCNIMHNVNIGDFTTIAPNALILGNVNIGRMCYIGANSTILPGISVGSNSIIGAGSVVTKNIPYNSIFAGNPAKKLKDNLI